MVCLIHDVFYLKKKEIHNMKDKMILCMATEAGVLFVFHCTLHCVCMCTFLEGGVCNLFSTGKSISYFSCSLLELESKIRMCKK